MTVQETLQEYIELAEKGLVKCAQIDEHEYMFYPTEAALEEAGAIADELSTSLS